MGALSPEERPKIGALANQVREQIEEKLQNKIDELSAKLQNEKLKAEEIDVTIPGKRRETGKLHPLSTVLGQVKDIFIGMGFSIAEGPDVGLTTIILRHSISRRTILHATHRIRSISMKTSCCGRRPRRCRCVSWNRQSRRFGSLRRARVPQRRGGRDALAAVPPD